MPTQITENYCTVSAAYGRDYRNKAAALADFLGGKDFVLRGLRETYCSVRDFAPGTIVKLRYKRDTTVTTITIPKPLQRCN